MYVQPLEGSAGPNSVASPGESPEGETGFLQGTSPSAAGDDISRFVPPWQSESAGDSPYGAGYGTQGSFQGLFGPLMGMLQQLMQMLQSMMGYGCNAPYGSGNCQPNGKERYFQNATGSSDGDPHLSFNGARWNSMVSQPNLLNSNSFTGGFQISTQTTPPNGKGVAWNQSATIALNNGATTIAMSNQGVPSITSFGQSLSIARGQTVQLGDGESVKYQENGALRICAENGMGGRIDTMLTPQGNGVNVDVTAHDVDLGGALVKGFIPPISVPEPVSTDPGM
jgi:hypothetical protein